MHMDIGLLVNSQMAFIEQATIHKSHPLTNQNLHAVTNLQIKFDLICDRCRLFQVFLNPILAYYMVSMLTWGSKVI